MEAIVLAGDIGDRPEHIGFDVPKPMAPVDGLPFLEYILVDLIENGVDRIVMAVNHMKKSIMDYFGDEFRGVPIVYSVEDVPLKTGGAIKRAIWHCKEERVIVVDGNTLFKVPLKEMHKFAVSKDAPVVIAVKEMFNFS
ncbi:MAG: NTP transferase domain-containing protein, partial [Oscillospiraceae bacterium]|nr:NTP transferase domain-containing protein [Oscillospiraceae bacterium]